MLCPASAQLTAAALNPPKENESLSSELSIPEAGNGAVHAIYPMPYVLKLGSSREPLAPKKNQVSHVASLIPGQVLNNTMVFLL